MSATIPHPAPQLDDIRVTAARRALAELPEADSIDRPWFWIGRLRTRLAALVTAWPSGVHGGLDEGQREVLGQALADALDHRMPDACEECDIRPEGLCSDHAADLDLTDAYLALARELGIQVAQ